MLISITGPECSGKTTLADFLKKNPGVTVVDEFAREFLSKSEGQYTFADLDVIAKGQIAAVGRGGFVISDTFLLVILIWSLHKYGKASETVQSLYNENKPDFYLLCKPDIPWKYDKLRENQHEREELFEQYLERIKTSCVPYFIVQGLGSERMSGALRRVVEFRQKNYLSHTKRGA